MNRTVKGLDYSFGRPDLGTVKAQGYRFVMRYLTGAGKALTAQEVAGLKAHGLAIGVVFESTANRAGQGRAAGKADAETAAHAAAAVGLAGIPIYFAVDFDADPDDVKPYFSGARAVLGAARMGGYGSERVVRALHKDDLIRFVWQTVAWSQGKVYDGAHILQHAPSIKIGGADVDVNDAAAGAFGSMRGAPKRGPSRTWLKARLKIRRAQLERAQKRAARRARWIKHVKARIAALEKQLQGGKS